MRIKFRNFPLIAIALFLALVFLPEVLHWKFVVPVALVPLLAVAVLAGIFPRIYKGLPALRRHNAR